MKNSLKLIGTILFVGMVSVVMSVGTYRYMDDRKYGEEASSAFRQPASKLVAYGSVAENMDFTVAAENSIHGVVHIKSVINQASGYGDDSRYMSPFDFFFGQGNRQFQQQPKVGFGSGVIISTDGYIITNNHVISNADEIEVATNDNRTFKARLIGKDEVTDIALIKIEAENLTAIPFGDSDKLKVGEWVLAVGNPFNLTSTVTAGIVSAKGRGNVFPSAGGQMKIESFIQTDAAVNPGNSGGALVNIKGELVGINTAISSETGNYVGYSFAVPVSLVAKVATDLKQYGAVQRAMLGVTIANVSDVKKQKSEIASKLAVNEGAYVSGFATMSSAKEAGIEIGDVILSINDTPTKSVNELQEQINRYNPGTKVTAKVQRGTSTMNFNIELKNRQGGTDVIKNTSGLELLGGAFNNLSEEEKKQYGISFGIKVAGVTAGKLKEAGISNGFIILSVNETKIMSVEYFEKLIDQVTQQNVDDKGLFIKGFYPNGKVRFYAINLNE